MAAYFVTIRWLQTDIHKYDTNERGNGDDASEWDGQSSHQKLWQIYHLHRCLNDKTFQRFLCSFDDASIHLCPRFEQKSSPSLPSWQQSLMGQKESRSSSQLLIKGFNWWQLPEKIWKQFILIWQERWRVLGWQWRWTAEIASFASWKLSHDWHCGCHCHLGSISVRRNAQMKCAYLSIMGTLIEDTHGQWRISLKECSLLQLDSLCWLCGTEPRVPFFVLCKSNLPSDGEQLD